MNIHEILKNKTIVYTVAALGLLGVAGGAAYFSNGSLYKGSFSIQPTYTASPASPSPSKALPKTVYCYGTPNPVTMTGSGVMKHAHVTWNVVDPGGGSSFHWTFEVGGSFAKTATADYKTAGTKTATVTYQYGPDFDAPTLTCTVQVIDPNPPSPPTPIVPVDPAPLQINPPAPSPSPTPLNPNVQPPSPAPTPPPYVKNTPTHPSAPSPTPTPTPQPTPQPAPAPSSAGAPSTDCTMFLDVKATDTDCAAIGFMNSIGAMTGNPNGTFGPNSLLQRDQIAKIILETFDLNLGTECSHQPFPDIGGSDWSFQYICSAASVGLVTGYQSGPDKGYYRPSRNVTRAEFLAILLRSMGGEVPSNNVSSYDDVPAGLWYSGFARYARDNGLFDGSNLFPGNFVTRREVARVIYRLYLAGKVW